MTLCFELHDSITYVIRLFLSHESCILQYCSYFYVEAASTGEIGKFGTDEGENLIYGQFFTFIFVLWNAKEEGDHLTDICDALEGDVMTHHFYGLGFVEPIAGTCHNFVHQLGIELWVIDWCCEVYDATLRYADAYEATAAGWVGQRMEVVGRGYE